MFEFGEVISYLDLCQEEKANLQRGMNFHLHNSYSIILMSVRKNAPYADRIEDEGKTLIYEGHDIPNRKDGPNPKSVDQPMANPSGTLTQNGLFFDAAKRNKVDEKTEIVKVYEKIRPGIWTFNGYFKLVDAWTETRENRKVFKFRLELLDYYAEDNIPDQQTQDIEHSRIIPSHVKREVWKRDKGQCVMCGSKQNLHFDHIIPFSKGGSSTESSNIQLLCAKHNLQKHDKIQ